MLTILLICCAELGKTQKRFNDESDGRLKGFAISDSEHIINEYEGIPEVRAVKGRIINTAGAALPDALIEIRSEDPNDKVRGALTNDKGEFRFRSVHEGVYLFKATKSGFQSVFGKMRVSKTAKPENKLEIVLRVGV